MIKPFLKQVFFYLGIYALIRRFFPRKELAVLRYHAVCPPGSAYASPGICVTPEGFRRQIRYLARRYPVLPLDEAVERLRRG
ncbi:MAG: polysaccharide deacetylase family protein, partial [Nitrospinota bacterium]